MGQPMIDAILCAKVEAGLSNADSDFAKSYRTALRSLPGIVLAAGLLQAVSYCKSKDKSLVFLMTQLIDVLIAQGWYKQAGHLADLNEFEQYLYACDQREYQQLTLRCLNCLSKMKGFVDGVEFARDSVGVKA